MHQNQDISTEFDHDLMNYASSMIKSLVREKGLALEAYESTRTDAKAQIASLQAELAHRDYQLEKYISLFSDPSQSQHNHATVEPLAPATVMKVQQMTTTRNKMLELDNKRLERHVNNLLSSLG